jgi:hypothetical protein
MGDNKHGRPSGPIGLNVSVVLATIFKKWIRKLRGRPQQLCFWVAEGYEGAGPEKMNAHVVVKREFEVFSSLRFSALST